MAAEARVEETDSNTKKKLQIIVVEPGGTCTDTDAIALEVSSSDTVASLQARLESIRGIPPSQQRLVLQPYTWPPAVIDITRPPGDHGNSTSTPVAMETVAGADETSRNANKKMQIFVVLPRPSRDMNPNTIALEVSGSDTVASLKARLEDIDGDDRRIPAWRQRLVVAGSALPDDGVTTLADLGVGESSTVQLVETHMQVSVRDDRVRYISLLSSTDTVDTLKARYEAIEGVPADRQRLTLKKWLRFDNGVDLENGRTLADYGVRDGSEVTHRRLSWHRTDAYMALGRVLEVKVRGKDTVGHVKRAVKAKVGVPVAAQRAYHTNKQSYELEDLEDGRTMEELGFMVSDGYVIGPPRLDIECPQEALAGGAKEEEAAAEGRVLQCRLFNGDLREYYTSQKRKYLDRSKRQAERKEEELPYWRPPMRLPYRILHVILQAPDPLLP